MDATSDSEELSSEPLGATPKYYVIVGAKGTAQSGIYYGTWGSPDNICVIAESVMAFPGRPSYLVLRQRLRRRRKTSVTTMAYSPSSAKRGHIAVIRKV